MINIVCTGGRDFKDKDLVESIVVTLGDEDVRFHVGDASGVDLFVRDCCDEFGFECRVYEADWDAYGRSAGPIRNKRMLRESNADLVIAFPGGRGTENCVKQAKELGIPVLRVEV